MDQQFTAYTGPSLEKVQQRFEQWRAGRKRGTPIPAALWEDAVHLCADHSLCKISSALHLGYKALKKRFQSACTVNLFSLNNGSDKGSYWTM